MNPISFKQRVLNIAIEQAKIYQTVYVEWEYLICSEAFTQQNYYIIDAKQDNYQHLIGVHSHVSPQIFFTKCLSSTLTTADFDFVKPHMDEKTVKGSVRRKIKALSHMMTMLDDTLLVQESFVKNRVVCTFASSDGTMTLGFIGTKKSRPMTLLAKNELDMTNAKPVDVIIKRQMGEKLFNQVVVGTKDEISCYAASIAEIVAPELIL